MKEKKSEEKNKLLIFFNKLMNDLQKTIKTFLSGSNKSFKFIIVILLFFFFLIIVNRHLNIETINYNIGELISEDYISPVDFSVYNEEQTKTVLASKIASIPPVYRVVPENESIFYENLKGFAEQIMELKNSALSNREKITYLRNKYPFLNVTDRELTDFTQKTNHYEITNYLYRLSSPYFQTGIAPNKQEFQKAHELLGKNTLFVIIKYPNGNRITKDINEVIYQEDAVKTISHNFGSLEYRRIFELLIANITIPNIFYSINDSKSLEQDSLKNYEGETDQYSKGQLILKKGNIFSSEDQTVIGTLNTFIKKQINMQRKFGLIVFLFILIVLFYNYLKKFKNKLLKTNDSYLIIFFCLLIFWGISSFILYMISISNGALVSFYLLPVSFFVFIIAIFLESNIALYLTVLISVISAFFFGYNIDVAIYGIINSAFTIYFTKNVSRRSVLFFNFLLLGILSIPIPVFLGFIHGFSTIAVFYNCISVLLGNILSYILIISIIPFFEALFDIPTRFQLVELLSGDHEVLKELSLIAPGTYQHSIMVGNLSEIAAKEIGADPILAKTASLFHDIGKTKNPEYFIENQSSNKNPHGKMSPLMSAKMIRTHATYGYQLAIDSMLPSPIRKVILEHHGTSKIQYFYNRAVEMQKNGNPEEIDPADYSYHGNKPTFKESAIVMFADRVEAKSRLLKNFKFITIRNMVSETLEELLFDEQQFTDCPITLQELHTISNSFVKSIQNMYHKRIEYEEENQS